VSRYIDASRAYAAQAIQKLKDHKERMDAEARWQEPAPAWGVWLLTGMILTGLAILAWAVSQ
jgi:hypothetical protein